MAMTKQHFEAVARRINQQREELVATFGPRAEGNRTSNVAHAMLEQLAAKLAIEFSYENARFDKMRFIAACGF